ncbi:MAG: FIST signal transduction protein [Bacteroidia bacterium]
MKIAQHTWQADKWSAAATHLQDAQLCLVFGSRLTLEKNPGFVAQLTALYPAAQIITSSTAGNIIGDLLLDDTLIATVVEFEKTQIKAQLFSMANIQADELGRTIAASFNREDIAGILLFSTSGINAGQLLNGINEKLQGRIPVSGGVAGDDTRFERTLVGLNHEIGEAQIAVVGFYGKHMTVAHGSKGGWDTFGPMRKVTKCAGNILYEIDDKPVLDLYKEYLGEKAASLPGSALLFPFTIIDSQTSEPVVRGVQNVDEATSSIILYGDVEEGMKIQLMRANFDNLIHGAGDSAKESFIDNKSPELAVLISCVARRLVLGQLTEEELAESRKVFGENTVMCGFYSYSELSPLVGDNACHLHNQTMTITTFSEA